MMSERRSFLKGAGIISAFVVGAASYKQVKEIANENKDISHLAPPSGATSLQINGSYGPPPELEPSYAHVGIGSGFTFVPIKTRTTHKVAMAVGKDNRLWIQVGDEWRRVALEG